MGNLVGVAKYKGGGGKVASAFTFTFSHVADALCVFKMEGRH